MFWCQYCEATGETLTCWGMFTMRQQKVIFEMKGRMLYNHSLWQIINIAWVMWIREAGWPTSSTSAVAHGSGWKKLFFHVLELAILKSYILLFCMWGGRQFHRDFFILPCKGYAAKWCTKTQVWRPLGRPPSVSRIISKLGSCGMPVPSKWLWCPVCSVRRVTQRVSVKCCTCVVRLYVNRICFKEYHTKVQL
jgi:hypothetical protein